ncbi:MAG: hypothetical protein CM15mP74_34870 [Halieaceae bacterium]|nr:MAG: hypothetical protein CM15mP74_34870 [Halieaceae bacterium]
MGSQLFTELRDFEARIRRIAAAVIEEITDIVGTEYTDEALILCAVVIEISEFVSARAERASRVLISPSIARGSLAKCR